MKYIIKISAIVLCLIALVGFATPEKKLNKLAAQVWKDKEIELQVMDLPDSLKGDFISLNLVTENGKTIGYACYTSAFGCKVGGCAAPSDPDTESNETFDYIVIYDTDLNIKKIDIADYGGQYGYEICRSKWLTQFIGQNSGFKLDENIDGISGATVSATYLINDLNDVGTKLKMMDFGKFTSLTN